MIMTKEIPADKTIAIRHSVLRAGMPVETCYWDADSESATFHLGGFWEQAQVGVATFQQEPFPEDGRQAYRLRGMAVLPEARAQGVGTLMLLAGEDRVRGMGIDLLWCYARSDAAGFYLRNGWTRLGREFEIPTAGPHYLMTKDLSAPHGCRRPEPLSS